MTIATCGPRARWSCVCGPRVSSNIFNLGSTIKMKANLLNDRIKFARLVKCTSRGNIHKLWRQLYSAKSCINSSLFLFWPLSTYSMQMYRVIILPDHIQWHTHSVGLLWTSNRIVAETSAWQHTTNTTDRYLCPWRDPNPQFQQPSGRRPTPWSRGYLDRPLEIYFTYLAKKEMYVPYL
jgi:hypothetical protein